MTYPWWQGARERDQESIPVCHACGQLLPAELSFDEALDAACAAFGVDRAAVLGTRRTDKLVTARAFTTWALRTLCNPPMSYPAIAAAFGGRQHTTAVHWHQKAVLQRLRDPAFIAACARLSLRVQAGRLGAPEQENCHDC